MIYQSMKKIMKRIPFAEPVIRTLKRRWSTLWFPGAEQYWENRYQLGGNSGLGSYHQFAEFKAEILNDFVAQNHIQSVIEFGCGDGNQLKLANYPLYIGLDVSPTAIKLCTNHFSNDNTKSFYLYHSLAFIDHVGLFRAELSLSLDVLFHLVDNDIFHAYMSHLFNAGQKYVIIYSSNFDDSQIVHERHHQFTKWVETYEPDWVLNQKIDNRYPYDPQRPNETSLADFYIFSRK